jgi:hypothetical protein
MDAGTPRVTPRVMSSIYTGETPAENGMMAVSKYGGEDTTRPKTSTIIGRAVREGVSVLSMGMPFSIPFNEVNEQSVLHGKALRGQSHIVPEEAGQLVSYTAPVADLVRGHPDDVYASFHDHTYSYFNQFKEAIRQVDPDVAFVGFRLVDSYCHFQHTETRGGQTYREHLIEDVEGLLGRIHNQIDGDVLFFSDHGQTELTGVFRVNRWLREKGYLDYSVDYDFIGQMENYQSGESHPISERVENQVTLGQPGVVVNEEQSDVVCADPFDSALTLLSDPGEMDTEALREDLLDTGAYRDVTFRWEEYDEDAAFYETVPHVLPDRDEGVFVSGNLHKNPIGMGYYRTGVHDYKACFGATRDLSVPAGNGRGGRVTPEQMYDVLADFIGLEVSTAPLSDDELRALTPREQELLSEDLDEVGV